MFEGQSQGRDVLRDVVIQNPQLLFRVLSLPSSGHACHGLVVTFELKPRALAITSIIGMQFYEQRNDILPFLKNWLFSSCFLEG